MRTRTMGIGLAFATAVVSGVSIYLNGHAVKHFGDATTYTTAKNAVAGILLLALLAGRREPVHVRWTPRAAWQVLTVAVIGGSVPFVLFFEGLARAEATQASFIQKTLVVWVALLAVPLLGERLGLPHVLAIVLLVAGQAWLVGSAGTVVFGEGEAMILAATLLWSVEVVVVKRLLGAYPSSLLAAARMGVGTVLLLAWLGITGRVGQVADFGTEQWRWVLLTGLLLAAYVATWYAALARAQAVDVTAVLVFGAVITALLSGAADGVHVDPAGVTLIAAGTALIAALSLRRPRPRGAFG